MSMLKGVIDKEGNKHGFGFAEWECEYEYVSADSTLYPKIFNTFVFLLQSSMETGQCEIQQEQIEVIENSSFLELEDGYYSTFTKNQIEDYFNYKFTFRKTSGSSSKDVIHVAIEPVDALMDSLLDMIYRETKGAIRLNCFHLYKIEQCWIFSLGNLGY